MGDDRTGAWRVWSKLERKEDELKWCGQPGGFGRPHDSMGRLADAACHLWGSEQMGRVQRVRRALSDSGPLAQRLIAQRLAGIDVAAIWPFS
ncbi:hypothetical protein OU994_01315 [Pseudoduganella sp. SL102]|uniref:hypothetical protein n=1 Tax=Pseudoduganella sp. SL102 TaxID=2995154 RepID=UPI00248CB9FA|nr:hypothetical protein [Pseudoduganella sp. SL102]WBS02975.1 hypothetical protein OU994_01315 [Pseudoduganella sp. SL102]